MVDSEEYKFKQSCFVLKWLTLPFTAGKLASLLSSKRTLLNFYVDIIVLTVCIHRLYDEAERKGKSD